MRTIPVLLAYMSLWLLMQTPLVAQDPTILVSGKASLEAVPDRVQFNFFLEQTEETYEQAISGLNRSTKELMSELLKEGFSEDDLKTLSFQASPHYEYHEGKRRQRGFRASQSLEVTFDNDPIRIGKIVKRMAGTKFIHQMNLGFILSREKKLLLREELLRSAMEDARLSAVIIADTQQKKIEGFKEVRYGMNEPHYQPVMRADAMLMKSESADFGGFQPKEMTLSEEVTVVWVVK